MSSIKNNQKGQSLLELLVALLVLMMVLTATIALIVNSINAGRDSRDRIIATNLAREGIEIVRAIRDSNWIDASNPNWDDGLVGDSPAIPFVNARDATTSTILYFDPASQDQTQVKLYSDAYVQGPGTPGVGTQFYRTIYINPICQDSAAPNPNEVIVGKTETATCGQGGYVAFSNKVGIRVIVEVHWPSAASTKKVIVEDRLYNWQVL